jgi:hypothetical protein
MIRSQNAGRRSMIAIALGVAALMNIVTSPVAGASTLPGSATHGSAPSRPSRSAPIILPIAESFRAL